MGYFLQVVFVEKILLMSKKRLLSKFLLNQIFKNNIIRLNATGIFSYLCFFINLNQLLAKRSGSHWTADAQAQPTNQT
jgi:hypothetical protein